MSNNEKNDFSIEKYINLYIFHKNIRINKKSIKSTDVTYYKEKNVS